MAHIKGVSNYGFVPAHLAPLQAHFHTLQTTPTAINEHLETLRRYSKSSDVVCELGVDTGQSTTALLMGQPSTLYSFDLIKKPEIESLVNMATLVKRCPDHIEAKIGNTFWIFTFPFDTSQHAVPPCDLLFIDTWHAYPQLAAELALNSDRTRKFIILHDTVSFGEHGEGWQDWAAAGKGELKGINFALVDFLHSSSEWVVKETFSNNNGLTVLGRKL